MTKNTSSGKTPDIVVDFLAAAVKEKGQSAVARESGIALYSVQRYLKGIGYPTEATFQKLADYFGISVWQLQGGSGGFFWANSQDVVDKVLRLSDMHFNTILENDYRLINDFAFIGVVLSLATLVLEINSTENSNGNYDFTESVQNKAKRVIERYGDWHRQGMVDVLSETADKFEERAE